MYLKRSPAQDNKISNARRICVRVVESSSPPPPRAVALLLALLFRAFSLADNSLPLRVMTSIMDHLGIDKFGNRFYQPMVIIAYRAYVGALKAISNKHYRTPAFARNLLNSLVCSSALDFCRSYTSF